MSALAGYAPSVTALPRCKHIATAAGTLLAVLPSVFCGNNVAELENDSEPEFGGRFVTEFVARSVAGNMDIRTIDPVSSPLD